MPDNQLNPCLHCGEFISRLAMVCPKCQTKKPKGIVCRICDQRLPIGEAICVKDGGGYHRKCLAPEFAYADLSCPHCQRPITTKHVSFDSIIEKSEPECPHCGNPDVLGVVGNCDCCDLPICEALGQTNAAPIASVGQTHTFCQASPTPGAKAVATLVNLPSLLIVTMVAFAIYYLFVLLRF